MKSIYVIESKTAFNPQTKQTCSMYGAIPPGYHQTKTNGFTWRLIDHEGRITIGMGRKAVKTRIEAFQIAKKSHLFKQCGYSIGIDC